MTHNLLICNDLFISLGNPEAKIHRTGVSTFAIRTSNRTTKVFERACKADPRKNFNFYRFDLTYG